MTHLVARGRTRLVLLSSLAASGGDPGLRVRREAALACAANLGVPLEIIEAERHVSSTLAGYRAVARADERFRGTDGLFCDRDEHALGALAALRAIAALGCPRTSRSSASTTCPTSPPR